MKKLLICFVCLTLLMVSVANASEIGLLTHVELDGVDYVERTNVTTVLLMGLDNREETGERLRAGGQADFIMLVVLDHDNKQIRSLQIDRDTMTDIPTVDAFGRPNGTRHAQLCLAHSVEGGKTGCETTVQTVSHLLADIPIDLYVSLPLNGILHLNDVLGGVTVTLPEDYTASDPDMVKGATLTLTGEQAEIMMRSRMEVADGTNAARMERQNVFISAAAAQVKAMLKENAGFADTLLDALERDMVSNMNRGRLINELNRAYQYEIMPTETAGGEYGFGPDGFKEFYIDQDALTRWTVETLFVPR